MKGEQYNFSSSDLGNKEIFARFYDYYAPKIYKHALYRLNTKENTQDLVSQVFIKTWEYLADGNSIKNPKAFIYHVANNLIVDYYRSKNKNTVSLDLENNDKKVFDLSDEGDGLRNMETSADFNLTINLLNKVKPEHKDFLIWRYVDDLSISDIAKLSNKSKTSVAITIFRALKALKKTYSDFS